MTAASARFGRLGALAPEIPATRWVIHPMALASAFVLNLFIEAGVSPYAMFRSLAIGIAGSLLLTCLGWVLFRDRHKGGALASLILVVLVGWSSPYLLAAALALLVLIVYLLGHITGSGVPWPRATYALNVFGLVLLVALAIKVVTTGSLGQIAADLRQGGPLPLAAASPRANGPPDMFLILLDAYPRADTLQRVFGYDNEPFLSQLETRGFHVSPHSRSNYGVTQLTLASMLNMRLLDEIPELRPLLAREREAQPTLRNITNQGSALGWLRGKGYEIVATAPGFEEVPLRQADIFMDGGQLNEFEVTLMRLTALSELARILAPDFVAAQQRGRVEAGFRDIEVVVKQASERPRLAIIHLPIPHAPILYGSAGEARSVDPRHPYEYDSGGLRGRDEQIAAYRQQLDYLNGRILAALDAALAQPGPDPVVILWSDHGTLIDLDTDPQYRLTERVSNFFAARTPGHDRLFGDSPTLVNTFPTLLNAYFDADLPPAADRNFISAPATLFDWQEIPNLDAAGR